METIIKILIILGICAIILFFWKFAMKSPFKDRGMK